jgi:hypothetical protein
LLRNCVKIRQKSRWVESAQKGHRILSVCVGSLGQN